MSDDTGKEITIKYVIPDGMRDCYINGAYGGVSPRGEIHIHFYSERAPIPKSVTYTLDDEKKILVQDSSEYDFGGDILRLVQASVVMDVNTAINIRDWLDDKIKIIQRNEEKDHATE